MGTAKQEVDPDFDEMSQLTDTNKTSSQILSELFGTFDAEPPLIIKKERKEKDTEAKKAKKSKKKHKHKEKKHKKKSKKKKHISSSSSSSTDGESEIDLAQLLIKQEKDKGDEKIKIEGTSLSLDIKLEINKEEQKTKLEKHSQDGSIDTKQKIHIKDIQFSSIKTERVKTEDGEISDSDEDSKKSKKHRHKNKSSKRKHSRDGSKSRGKLSKYEDLRYKIKEKLSPERRKRESHESDFSRTERKHRKRSISRDRFYEKHREKCKHQEYRKVRDKSRERAPFRDDGFYRSRGRSRSRSRERYHQDHKSIERKYDKNKSEPSSRIDKKKLLEIARRNAIQMMKSGSLPGALSLSSKAQEKMISAIKSGGKSIEELTDFCKSLSKKEELGELSSLSEHEESEGDQDTFHHPFKLKDRPTTITMNITNSVPLPTKSAQERTTELRQQFPVSSGQLHRVNEGWVPVSPSSSRAETPKVKTASIFSNTAPLAIEAPPPPAEPTPKLIPAPPNAPPGPQIFPKQLETPLNADISLIVTQRLTAMRKLQENPNDVQALGEMYKSNKEMESWAKSKQQFGTFTGSTGAQVLSQQELSSGYQAWAKKDQLQTAAPVTGGMGMHLLQKMGWRPGEGLGKEKTGALEPLLLEVKLDKKGLVANEEQQKSKKKVKGVQTVKTLQGKHPVSLLGEYASKRKLGAPQYLLDFECGPDHKKNFLFKVILDGVEYKPNVASANKKEAKATAATLALKSIGLMI
ncbi:protein Son [Euwallacea fornicatus]|uniref:protein Son n=1 Tax=Euwallacea fornicatus TaxID=995702 RepID=UPI00338DA7AB